MVFSDDLEVRLQHRLLILTLCLCASRQDAAATPRSVSSSDEESGGRQFFTDVQYLSLSTRRGGAHRWYSPTINATLLSKLTDDHLTDGKKVSIEGNYP